MDVPHPQLVPVFDAIRDGRLDVALELARAVADQSQGDLAIEARRHVALCFFHLGDYASAVPNFVEVAEATGDRQSWFVLALARTLAGDPQRGEAAFQRALAAPEPPPDADGKQLTEHFMRFDYMHVLVDTWQWKAAKEQLDRLAGALRGLPQHDNATLFESGYPLLGDVLDAALRVLAIVPNSDPIAWLTHLRQDLSSAGRVKVDQAIVALARKLGQSVPRPT